MDVRGREITSICMMNIEEDGSIVGTVVNEMGVKAFDFTYANGKAKVINVLGPLNGRTLVLFCPTSARIRMLSGRKEA